jgi:hypothetical protein
MTGVGPDEDTARPAPRRGAYECGRRGVPTVIPPPYVGEDRWGNR